MSDDDSYNSIDANLEILHKAPKSIKLNTIEHFHIYNATKTNPSILLNEQKNFAENIMFDSLINIQNKKLQ